MTWDDLRPGMFVVIDSLDHFDAGDEDGGSVEYPFQVWGEVMVVDELQAIMEGAWVWMNDTDWNFGDAPVSYGRFGIVRTLRTTVMPHPGPGAFGSLRRQVGG